MVVRAQAIRRVKKIKLEVQNVNPHNHQPPSAVCTATTGDIVRGQDRAAHLYRNQSTCSEVIAEVEGLGFQVEAGGRARCAREVETDVTFTRVR